MNDESKLKRVVNEGYFDGDKRIVGHSAYSAYAVLSHEKISDMLRRGGFDPALYDLDNIELSEVPAESMGIKSAAKGAKGVKIFVPKKHVFVEDPAMPEDEIHLKQNGKTVCKLINLKEG